MVEISRFMHDVKYSQIWKSSGLLKVRGMLVKYHPVFRLEFDIQSFIIKIWIVNKGSQALRKLSHR